MIDSRIHTDFRLDPSTDPRTVITPDAFRVAPELLGLALAKPWRRAVAILVDLALVAILANAQAVFLAFAFGVFVFWLAVRRRRKGAPRSAARTAARATLGCMGAIALTVATLVTWFAITTDPEDVLFEADAGGTPVPVTLSGISDVIALARGGDSTEVAAAAERLAERLEEQDVPLEDVQEVLAELSGAGDSTLVTALGAVLETPTDTGEARADTLTLDSLLARYSDARAAEDTLAASQLGPILGTRLAADALAARDDRISGLEDRTERLDTQLERTRAELDAERNRGIVNSVIGALDELGLGIGWSGLYFTFFLGFWRGRTPGKRLLGVRVVRLDGRPLGFWVSFERFGGYAASLFTGLEGFARILWDRNRQALEDKLAETVVIRDTDDAKQRVALLHEKAAAGGGPAARRQSRG